MDSFPVLEIRFPNVSVLVTKLIFIYFWRSVTVIRSTTCVLCSSNRLAQFHHIVGFWKKFKTCSKGQDWWEFDGPGPGASPWYCDKLHLTSAKEDRCKVGSLCLGGGSSSFVRPGAWNSSGKAGSQVGWPRRESQSDFPLQIRRNVQNGHTSFCAGALTAHSTALSKKSRRSPGCSSSKPPLLV